MTMMKKIKKTSYNVIKIVLCTILSIQLVNLPQTMPALANDDAYDAVFSGKQKEPIILYSGTYLFENVEVEGNSKIPSAITVAEGNDVTVFLHTKIYAKGADAEGNELTQSRAGAGIRLPESSKLTIRGTGKITAVGGNAGQGGKGVNGDVVDISDPPGTANMGGRGGYGGNGAGAGIGGEGGTSSGATAEGMGRLEVWDSLVVDATGGNGGNGGDGGRGGSSVIITAVLVNYGGAGGGGGGGGGGGMPAANIGGGGIKGGNGGNGGNASSNDLVASFKPMVFSGGAGGGGGAGWSGGGGGGNGQFSLATGMQPTPIFNTKQTGAGYGGSNGGSGGEGGKQMSDGGGFSIGSDEPGKGGGRTIGGNGGYAPQVEVWPWGGMALVTYYKFHGENVVNPGGILKYPVYLSEQATMSSYTTGGGQPNLVPGQVLPIYDLSHSDTKIYTQPTNVDYTGDKVKPKINVYSAKGVYIHEEAYRVNGIDNSILVGGYDFTITGKETEYTPMRVVNSSQGHFNIVKASRKISLELDKPNINIEQRAIASIKGYEAGGDVKWEILEGSDLCTTKDNGASLEIFAKSTGTVKIKATIGETDNYLGAETQVVTLLIFPAGAELFSFGEIGSFIYTAHPITPKFPVYFGKKTLEESKDYNLTYFDNINVGEGCAMVNGVNDYTDQIPVWFVIAPADIKNVTFSNVAYDAARNGRLPNVIFTGEDVSSPIGKGTFNGVPVKEGTDYTVTYSNTYTAGEVLVTVTGMGNFAGSKAEFKYQILPADINNVKGLDIKDIFNMEYNGTFLEPNPQITLNGVVLFEGVDYTLEYENNRNAGTATVIIRGKGNFTESSSKHVDFQITQRNIMIAPELGQLKSSGEDDPQFTYQLKNVVTGDKVSMKEGGVLTREEGELVGNYRFLIGTLALDEKNPVNKNYKLILSDEVVTFEIKEFWVVEDATIIGTVGKNGWYIDNVRMVPPSGYKISYSPSLKVDAWEEELIPGDGDFTNGLTYFLREYNAKTDKLEKISQAKTVYIKQDTISPTGRIIANDVKLWQKFTDVDKFTSFFKDEIGIDIISEDATSGIDALSYFVTDKELTKEKLIALPENKWTSQPEREKLLTVDVDQKIIIYARFEDKAGHILYINSDGMILDRVAPIVKVDYAYDGVWIADKDITAQALVTESLSQVKDRYADIRYQSATALSNPTLIDLDVNGEALIENLPDGDNLLIVTVQDNSGNTGRDQVNVKKDTWDPLMFAETDLETYAQFKDILLKPQVGPSGVEEMYVQRQEYGNPVDKNGSWDKITVDFNTLGYHHVEENGSYYFRYINRAKVESNIAEIHIDRIDKSVPSIEIKATKRTSNIDYKAAEWTNEVVRVTFKNTSDNLGITKYQYRLNNGAWTTFEKGNDYQVQFDILDTGIYNIDFRVESESGLSANATYEVRVDKVKPKAEFELQPVTTRLFSLLNKPQNALMSATDAHSGMKEISYFVVDSSHLEHFPTEDNEEKEEYVLNNGGYQTVPGNNTARLLGSNDTYVVFFKAVDKAGNESFFTSDELMIDGVGPTITFDESDFVDYGPLGKWLASEDALIEMEVVDDYSGVDYVEYTIGAKTVKLVYGVNEMCIKDIPDGINTITVVAYDKAGNKTTERLEVQKDATDPSVKIDADTVNLMTSQHASFELDVDPAGLKKIEMEFVPKGGIQSGWVDITTSYQNGYTVVAPGTLYVYVEDKLSRKSEVVSVVFDNIQYVEAKAKIDAVDLEGNVISTDKWLPRTNVRIYNENANVSNFTYEYKTDGDSIWKKAETVNGYALLSAPEGETTYTARVKNNVDVPDKWSDEVTLTVKVDAYDPTFGITTSQEKPLTWTGVTHPLRVWGTKSAGNIILKDLMDPGNIPSGIVSGEYAIFESNENQQLKEYPKSNEDIKNVKGWRNIPNKTLKETVKENGTLKIYEMQQNKEYVVCVRIKDEAGNTSYALSDIISIDSKAPTVRVDDLGNGWYTNATDKINVDINDNLSGASGSSYKISYIDENDQLKETTYMYQINDRIDKFEIPLHLFVEGNSTLTINGVDKAGNTAVPKTIQVRKDTTVPVIVAREEDDEASAVMDVQFNVQTGVSKVLKVEVIHNGISVDITSSYKAGYKITRNGIYEFYVTNGAGVRSAASIVEYDRPYLPPNVILKAFTSDNKDYVKGTWTNLNVKVAISDEQLFTGVSTYWYSLNEGVDWTEISPTNNEYWLLLDKSGKYDMLFKIASPAGVESDVFPYSVYIQKEKPTISITKSTESLTKDPVTLSVHVEPHYTDVQYSFDGGISYHDKASLRIPYNDKLKVLVRDEAGNVAIEEANVDNIDMQHPIVQDVRKQETKVQNKEIATFVYIDAFDAPKTSEQAHSGMKEIFWTFTNPYTSGNLSQGKNDVAFVYDEQTSRYSSKTAIKFGDETFKYDNSWIVGVDNVGNATISSVRLDTLVDPGNDVKGENTFIKADDIVVVEWVSKVGDKSIDEIVKYIDRSLSKGNMENSAFIKEIIHVLKNSELPLGVNDLKAEIEMIEKLLKGDLSKENKKFLQSRLNDLNLRYYSWWLLIIILIIINAILLVLLLKKKKSKDDETNTASIEECQNSVSVHDE